MGDRIPFKALMPNRKYIQKKIVAYHNYFRGNVMPKARDMLRMVGTYAISIFKAMCEHLFFFTFFVEMA